MVKLRFGQTREEIKFGFDASFFPQENDMKLLPDPEFLQPGESKEERLEQVAREKQMEEQETVSKEDTALSASWNSFCLQRVYEDMPQ